MFKIGSPLDATFANCATCATCATCAVEQNSGSTLQDGRHGEDGRLCPL